VAIQSGQNGPFVFVVKPDRKAEMRKVELVGLEGDHTALASGVNAGEQVIVEGQMRLVDGSSVIEVVTFDTKQSAPDATATQGAKTDVQP